jgi:SAM-dependent methyltransferase
MARFAKTPQMQEPSNADLPDFTDHALDKRGRPDLDHEKLHSEAWVQEFDAGPYQHIQSLERERIGRDFIGWDSLYDGEPIDKVEMEEWLDDTIATIYRHGDPTNVLEIGTGSGMILFNLAESLRSYVGIDVSPRATRFVNHAIHSMPCLVGKAEVLCDTAASLGTLDCRNSPDMVILNSTIQYFPSLEYLQRVTEEVLRMGGVEYVVFGDVRSFAMYKEFQVTKSLRVSGNTSTPSQQELSKMEEVEEELLVDPAFFTKLKDLFPGLVSHVEILPKRMAATNELSCFRYSAIVHTTRQHDTQRQLHKLDHQDWIDYISSGLDKPSLTHLLIEAKNSSFTAVCNIPYEKTIEQRCAVDDLIGRKEAEIDNEKWHPSACWKAEAMHPLSALDLEDVAQSAGHSVSISWARQFSQRGGLDAIFHKLSPSGRKPVLFDFPTDHNTAPNRSLSSKPRKV